jgi:hypothetical protein
VQLAPRCPSARVERSAFSGSNHRAGGLQAPWHTFIPTAPDQLAVRATVHCLTGCSIGEVLGMALGTRFGWSNATAVIVSAGLAFLFGYALTLVPLQQVGPSMDHRGESGACSRYTLDHAHGNRG